MSTAIVTEILAGLILGHPGRYMLTQYDFAGVGSSSSISQWLCAIVSGSKNNNLKD